MRTGAETATESAVVASGGSVPKKRKRRRKQARPSDPKYAEDLGIACRRCGGRAEWYEMATCSYLCSGHHRPGTLAIKLAVRRNNA
jgi:hypothetical protein